MFMAVTYRRTQNIYYCDTSAKMSASEWSPEWIDQLEKFSPNSHYDVYVFD